MKKKKSSDITILEKRISKLREALHYIAQAGMSDNPYAPPIDRTQNYADTAEDALKEDDKLND
jgi:hypothetical protein